MRYYTKQHQFTCDIDLQACLLYVCILDRGGEIVLHKPCKGKPGDLMCIRRNTILRQSQLVKFPQLRAFSSGLSEPGKQVSAQKTPIRG